jgi:hypothetical protein
MKLAWKDGMTGAVLYDETGKIVGEINETQNDGTHSSIRVFRAVIFGEEAGAYISRETARRAVEKAVAGQ